jgi:hypothetical protein
MLHPEADFGVRLFYEPSETYGLKSLLPCKERDVYLNGFTAEYGAPST